MWQAGQRDLPVYRLPCTISSITVLFLFFLPPAKQQTSAIISQADFPLSSTMLTSTLYAALAALAGLSQISAHVLVKVDKDSGLAIDPQYRVIGEDDTLIVKDLNQDYQFNILQQDGKQTMPTFTVVTKEPHGEFLEVCLYPLVLSCPRVWSWAGNIYLYGGR